MDTIREEVVRFMENDEEFSKLKNEKWYEMEDKLVALCEKVSGKKDETYRTPRDIVNDWVKNVAEDGKIDEFLHNLALLDEDKKDYGNIMPLVNEYFGVWNTDFGVWNTDGELDGLAMELEEYFETEHYEDKFGGIGG